MSFTTITADLQSVLKSNLPQIRFLLKKNPAIAYTRITELGKEVGRKYNINLLVNFPQEGKIENFEMYGKQDLSIIVDQLKTHFPIEREVVKQKARDIFKNADVQDAYLYEGKEGVRVVFEKGRIDVLPHSLHVWCEFSDKVAEYCDWLLVNVYELGS